MILHQNVYLPDGEEYLVDWMTNNGEVIDGKGTYQIIKLRAALEHCIRFRTAVDIGAHVGLWSLQLAKHFYRVEAFEPVEAYRACFLKNVKSTLAEDWPMDSEWARLYPCALGDREGTVAMKINPAISCKSRIDKGAGHIPLRTLDSCQLTDVDFIKIDTEGFELNVVKGAERTIKDYRPTMIVEQKGHGATYFGFRKEEAVELLESWGMTRQLEINGDWIMVWPNAGTA